MPPGTSYGMASLVSVNWPHADWCLHSDRMVTFAIFFLSPFGPSGDVKFIPTFTTAGTAVSLWGSSPTRCNTAGLLNRAARTQASGTRHQQHQTRTVPDSMD